MNNYVQFDSDQRKKLMKSTSESFNSMNDQIHSKNETLIQFNDNEKLLRQVYEQEQQRNFKDEKSN